MARRCSPICLPISQEGYQGLIDEPQAFRAWHDTAFASCPEFFPEAFAYGYCLRDDGSSSKTGVTTRRIRFQATGKVWHAFAHRRGRRSGGGCGGCPSGWSER